MFAVLAVQSHSPLLLSSCNALDKQARVGKADGFGHRIQAQKGKTTICVPLRKTAGPQAQKRKRPQAKPPEWWMSICASVPLRHRINRKDTNQTRPAAAIERYRMLMIPNAMHESYFSNASTIFFTCQWRDGEDRDCRWRRFFFSAAHSFSLSSSNNKARMIRFAYQE